jgi:hypothetical protein
MAQQRGGFKVQCANLVSRTKKPARNKSVGKLLRSLGAFNFPAVKLAKLRILHKKWTVCR